MKIKIYEKTFENVLPTPEDTKLGIRVTKIGSTLGDEFILADKFKELYREAHRNFFDTMVKQTWLERTFTYGGQARMKRGHNGHAYDWAFGYFMKSIVGINQRPITNGFTFQAVVTYLPELFPDFFTKDPYVDKEYYAFPYKNIGIDHMIFVYRMKERLQLLEYSENHNLSFSEFVNWVVNYAFSLNQELGKDVYALKPDGRYLMHIFPIVSEDEKKENLRIKTQQRNDLLKSRSDALVLAQKAIKAKKQKEKARLERNKRQRGYYKKLKYGK